MVWSSLPCPDKSRDFPASDGLEFPVGLAGEGGERDIGVGPASAIAEASTLGILPCPDASLVGNNPPGMPGFEGGAVRARLLAICGGDSDVSESA